MSKPLKEYTKEELIILLEAERQKKISWRKACGQICIACVMNGVDIKSADKQIREALNREAEEAL